MEEVETVESVMRSSTCSTNCSENAGGLRPRGPPYALTRGDPCAPLRSRGSLAQLARAVIFILRGVARDMADSM